MDECEGARACAIELRSFSKNAGFTGVRLGATTIPKDLKCGDVMLHSLWARRHGTKYNGAPYIVQKAGEAVYSEAGKAQLNESRKCNKKGTDSDDCPLFIMSITLEITGPFWKMLLQMRY